MQTSAMCIACILSKQELAIRDFKDEEKKAQFMHRLLGVLYEHAQTESAPAIGEWVEKIYKEFWGESGDWTEEKHKYNRLLLSMEGDIQKKIQASGDPIKECIKYVCAGNYIDFSAVENVSETTLGSLLNKAAQEEIAQGEYERFRADLEKGKRLVYLTDNCGEIVLDKIFIGKIKEVFPHLEITAIVRGENVINDATLADAKEVGLTDLVPCIGNGTGAPGTVLKRLSEEARKVLLEADVIIAKGQGNFESLYGEKLNPYFLFLCKCELFVRRFGLKQFSTVFLREDRIKIRQ